ncbi:MAG TPA: hypothetical protein VKY59_16945 [Spirillospora sp.]|nr:hypothetical protein [Spirillospora sp.]
MNLDTVSDKNLQELERLSRELLLLMRKANLKDDLLVEALYRLERQAGDLRRERFDAANQEYSGY